MNIEALIKSQRHYFETHRSKPYAFRIHQLQQLKTLILHHQQDIMDALKKDLNKSETESYMSEIGMVLSELNFTCRHLKRWMKRCYKPTPIAQFCASSFITPQPYGVVLIMSPWNYPFMLTMTPLIGAIAAGNCAIVKPSAYAPHTSRVMYDLIHECFPCEYVACVEGGRKENSELLEQRFDYIFFTGSVTVGKLVMEKASRYVTPVTLELGGKSPCIVDEHANVKLAAKRIVFGKYLNAGQTCVAPDYLFLHENIKKEFIAWFHHYVNEFFSEDPLHYEKLPHIINDKHFKRLLGLMKDEEILIGGSYDEEHRIISPTLLDHITYDSKIMQEEIFGPILPIITYTDINEIINYINTKEKPLALYLFTNHKKVEHEILMKCSFGGGCINDTIIHLASNYLPFGGVGASGMGSYHGKKSFETFSHHASIVKKATWIDLPIRYQPYTKCKDKLIRIFMK